MNHSSPSILLLTYNQELFVKEALQSLLDQDIDDLEIVISDDCSSDKSWEVIEQVCSAYQGQKKIILNRNLRNLGVVANFFRAFNLSSGDVIFTGGGDDISLPTRCSDCVHFWLLHEKKPDLIATDAYDMHLCGEILGTKHTDDLSKWDLKEWAKKRPFIFGASHMLTRRLLAFNTIESKLPYEDQCLLFRALLLGGAVRLPKCLVMHRRGGISQQAKNYDYLDKKQKLIKSSLDAILESDQMLADSLLRGGSEFIQSKLALNKSTAQYSLALMQAEGLYEKLKLFFKTPNISWQKRFRYFQFSAFPLLHRLLLLLKSIR